MDLHRLGEKRSIAYHRALAARLDTAMIARAVERLATHPPHPALARAWMELLALSPTALATKLVEDSESMAQLRSASPFAGELAPRERWEIWRAVREATT